MSNPYFIELPGSKSIAARALILNQIYGNHTDLINLPACDDTRELAHALKLMTENPGGNLKYDLGTGGTSLRFFIALAASTPGFKGIVDCSDALKRRPHTPLIKALREAGAKIKSFGEEDTPPYYIEGQKLSGLANEPDYSKSSQFASALAMASLLWEKPYIPDLRDISTSRPYAEMTIKMIEEFASQPSSYLIESDWSAAAFFYEWALLNPGKTIFLKGLLSPNESLQGDSQTAVIFAKFGVQTNYSKNYTIINASECSISDIELDMRDVPDLVPALACGLCCAGIRFKLDGVANLKHKESDRIAALQMELGKAGYKILYAHGSLVWEGTKIESLQSTDFDSHYDHRIAMALLAAGVASPQTIRNAEVISKSFPDFLNQLLL